MKKDSIKSHLKDYSIYQKRWTTVNHAFAAALSAADLYDAAKVSEALRLLDQDPDGDLACIYCDKPGQTWDHVTSTVSKGKFSGVGHQIGNLVPCCKACNSSKGSRNWVAYIDSLGLDHATRDHKVRMITAYIDQNVINVKERLEQDCSAELQELESIKQQIYQLMKSADLISTEVRRKISQSSN